jgi:hypothetical protein
MSNKRLYSFSDFLDYALYDLPEEDQKDLRFLGQGKKNVMVIAKADDVGNEIEFLQSVLSPLGISCTEDAYIYLTPEPRVSFVWLCQNYDFSELLLFGVYPKDIGMQINAPFYQSINIAKKRLFFANDIHVFTSEKAKGGARPKAKQLWMALKSFFEHI